MNVLADSVVNTLKNLQVKRDFLAEQREYYIDIRNRLISFGRGADNEDDDEGAGDQGMVFGDIIISASKIYLSIGYEYYVEKTKEEATAFVDDKLKLMEDAVEQFDLKIKEAQTTLRNLNSMETEARDDQEEPDNEEGFLPSMEIREELDEEGNVISSSITPTSKQLQEINTEGEETSPIAQREERMAEKKKPSSFEENLKGKLSKPDTKVKRAVEPSKVDTENVYTFADLVQQMEEQDDLEEGSISMDDISYDYDAFENSNFRVNDHTQEDDEDTDQDMDQDMDGYGSHSIIPGFEAQSSFLKQISQLRSQKQFQEHKQDGSGVDKPLKPILKKSSAIEEPVKKQGKKRVGFASSLEIHEVENFKDENKKQMCSYTIPTYDIINNQEIMGPANEMTSDEFDGDLFAKMSGLQEADEIHDKYKDDLMNQEKHEEETNRSNRKSRVSKFKKNRASRKQDTPPNLGYVGGIIERQPAVGDIIEKEPVVGDIMERQPAVGDIIEKEPVVGDIMERQPAVGDIIEKEPVVGDIMERQPAVGDIIEKEPVVGDIMERQPAVDNSNKKLESLFKKKNNLKSLQKPRSSKLKKKKFDPKMLDNISDDDDDNDSKKPESDLNKNSDDVQERFPSKIQEVSRSISQAGAITEDKPVRITNVDYHALGGDMDDMVKAYSLGLYDDDLEEDPGTIVEKLEDFKEYNKQVELLRDEIRDFQLENPPVVVDEEESDGKIMVDVVEREFPESYTNDEDEVALHPDRLQESVAIEYRRLKETAALSWQSSPLSTHDEDGLEPIDEFGNPVKTSRFRSQRLHMGSK